MATATKTRNDGMTKMTVTQLALKMGIDVPRARIYLSILVDKKLAEVEKMDKGNEKKVGPKPYLYTFPKTLILTK